MQTRENSPQAVVSPISRALVLGEISWDLNKEIAVDNDILLIVDLFIYLLLLIFFTEYTHECSDIVIDECRGIPGFTKTVVSPQMQKLYQNFINSSINYNASDPQCSRLRKEIVCAENMPACHNGSAWFLCRDNCLNFFEKCQSPFFYGKNMCMEFPKREGSAPGKFPVCKQTHWPRSENWQIPVENRHTLATPSVGKWSHNYFIY